MSQAGWRRVDEQEETVEESGVNGRLYLFRVIMIFVLGLLVYRVYWLQQTKGPALQELATENQFAILRSDAPRGVIFDRHGEDLAVNLPSFNVTITPAFLPRDENERLAVFERLSLLTGVPVTNTIQQRALVQAANPELVDAYSRLARIYGVSEEQTLDQANVVPQLPDSILDIFNENSFAQYLPAVITTNVPITLAYRIEEESIFLPGVRVIAEPLRYYPYGEYTAHMLGFMGPIPNENWISVLNYQRDDRVGWAGLESSMEIEMAGSKGERQIEQDWSGRELRQIGLELPPTAGLNLHLTIDADLQIITTELLRQAMDARERTPARDEITGANSFVEVQQGAVVAMNPQTGEILAIASLPTFDNNRFQTAVPVDYYLGLARNDYRPLLNHAINSTYPPGSTFKLVPAAGALQEGLVSPTRLLRAPGEILIDNRFSPNDPGRAQRFVCWVNPDEHGLMNTITGLANSCDIYFYKISGGFDQDGEFIEGLGINRLSRYAQQFGFGRAQGIELPREAAGDLPPNADWKAEVHGEPWSTGDDYNIGIGQGFLSATPMQVAQMAAVVANGGFLYRPSVIHHITDDAGNIIITDADGAITYRVVRGVDGTAVIQDPDGNPVDPPPFQVRFDEEGNYIYQPEVLGAVDVNREYLEIIAEGMELVNVRRSDEEFFTGATYVDWPTEIVTAGKTGTAEFCDQIAIEKGWCSYDDIILKQILPTHSWYVGYAPADDPEIVVAVFLYHGGEGSKWSAPVACHVMAAYFKMGQYAAVTIDENGEQVFPSETVCDPIGTGVYNPILPPEILYRDGEPVSEIGLFGP